MPKLFILVFVVAFIGGCGKKEEENKETNLVTFPVKGEVVAIDTVKKRLIIAHEEIPDYMMAMTMPFRVKDSTLLDAVQVGDSVQGTLAVSRTESWLESVNVIGFGEPETPLTAEEITFRKLFKVGEPIPDFSFVNQGGKRVRFSDFRGKALAFTFIYTRCPIPDYCIRMSDYFSRIQKALAKDERLSNKWHLLSVSFDPKNDTPEVLLKYGKNYGADFSMWDFVVEKESVIQQLGNGFDLTFYDDEGGLIAHNLRTVLIDPKGNLAHIIKDNEWKPDEVVALIQKLVN
ncbi:MAG: SCO family protein [Ignavibacteriae bacterium]|nr:SCO family protein [Ignavibacteriota bacterium]